MMIKNKSFRLGTLIFQSLAMAAFYLPTIIFGGNIGTFWLVAGVLHTALFCVVYFRNERRRTALSIIVMIFVILWSIAISGAVWFISVMGVFSLSIPSPVLVYSLCSLLAVVFALAGPRRFTAPDDEARDGGESQEVLQEDTPANA